MNEPLRWWCNGALSLPDLAHVEYRVYPQSPAGGLHATLVALAVAAAVVALGAALDRRATDRLRRRGFFVALSLWAGSLLACWWIVAWTREGYGAALHLGSEREAIRKSDLFEIGLATIELNAICSVPLVLVLGACALKLWPTRMARLCICWAAGFVLVTAATVAVHAGCVQIPYGCGDPEAVPGWFHDRFTDGQELLRLGGWTLGGVAGLALAVTLVVCIRQTRRGWAASGRAILVGLAVLVAGGVAFFSSRSSARDTYGPVPQRDYGSRHWRWPTETSGTTETVEVPEALCAPLPKVPLLRIYESDDADMLQRIRARRSLWSQLNPDSVAWRSHIGIAVGSRAPKLPIHDLLQALADERIANFFVVTKARPSWIDTASLGGVRAMPSSCAIEIHLNETGRAVSTFRDFDELAAAALHAASQSRVLAVAAPTERRPRESD